MATEATDARRSRAWTLTVKSALLVPLLSGCGLFGSPIPEGGKPVRQVYEEMDGARAPALLSVTPYPEAGAPPRTRPVIFPPRILAVYVQEHVDPERDFKIGAHFVYIKLRESSWTEEAIDREPPSSLPLDQPEDLAPVRKAFSGQRLPRALVPFQGPVPEKKSDEEKPKEKRDTLDTFPTPTPGREVRR